MIIKRRTASTASDSDVPNMAAGPESESPSKSSTVGDGVMRVLNEHVADANSRLTDELLGTLIQKDQYVGEVFSLGYESALVQIHDFHRQQVGGIPSLCLLVASRIQPESTIDYQLEDSSVILLRVMDSAPLPNQAEAERIRAESAQRVAGDAGAFWDESKTMDAYTAHLLSFAGVRCRIIGTFFVNETGGDPPLQLRFGSDISNYYPNRGLKVYKPNGDALRRIVNYRDTGLTSIPGLPATPVPIGTVRYASTNRAHQGVSNVAVEILPRDLIAQKTALFGMTRTGKSNTTKVILQSVFALRYASPEPLRVGQIVFDPNGEYANENVQDQGGNPNPSAIRNIWRHHGAQAADDVVTFGLTEHPNDPNRKLMLVNFYMDENLDMGKSMIDAMLAGDPSKYIGNFCAVSLARPDTDDRGALTRHDRRVLTYRALLHKAGFAVTDAISRSTKGLFGKDLIAALRASKNDYSSTADTLELETPSWGQLADAFEALYGFLKDPEYKKFNTSYKAGSSTGEDWADADLQKLLEMFVHAHGHKQLGKVRPFHTSNIGRDYIEDIYSALADGRLVLVDQSSGDYELNRESAYRIVTHIFKQSQERFRLGQQPPFILIYAEEAHTIMPAGSDLDTKDSWVRVAKEGAKYQIGLVYATQEVSSIQRNILKNTSNWFIGHLNNTDETRELVKYYDFADFELSIRRAQDKGFLRVKTLSNLFVVPVQVHKFEA